MTEYFGAAMQFYREHLANLPHISEHEQTDLGPDSKLSLDAPECATIVLHAEKTENA